MCVYIRGCVFAAFFLSVIGSLCHNVNLMICSAVNKLRFQMPKMMLRQMSLNEFVSLEYNELSVEIWASKEH